MNDSAVISVSSGGSIKSCTNIEENRELFLVIVKILSSQSYTSGCNKNLYATQNSYNNSQKIWKFVSKSDKYFK